MRAEDITDTLELALAASGCDNTKVLHKPRLLSDNGPSYIAAELAEWIEPSVLERRGWSGWGRALLSSASTA